MPIEQKESQSELRSNRESRIDTRDRLSSNMTTGIDVFDKNDNNDKDNKDDEDDEDDDDDEDDN